MFKVTSDAEWALRSAFAAALGFILIPIPQVIFPNTYLAPVMAIAFVQRTLGQTLITCQRLLISTLFASTLAVIITATLLQFPSKVFEITFPIIVFFATAFCTSLPFVDKALFSLTFFIGIGIPMTDSTQSYYYYGAKVGATICLGFAGCVVAAVLPFPNSAWKKSQGLLKQAHILTHRELVHLIGITEPSDARKVTDALQLSSLFIRTVEQLDSLRVAARKEVLLVCFWGYSFRNELGDRVYLRGTAAADALDSHIELLHQQKRWLGMMQSSLVGLQGEVLIPDQAPMIQKVLQPMYGMVRVIKEMMLSCGQLDLRPKDELAVQIKAMNSAFEEARFQVYHSALVDKNGQVITPVFSHSIRRSTNLLAFGQLATHLTTLCEGSFKPPKQPKSKQGKKSWCCSYFCNLVRLKPAIKLGLSLAIASLWYSIPDLRGYSGGRGLWIGITIAFVNSEDIGASVGKALNRLQGTMLACAFSLVTLRIVGNDIYTAGAFMVVWVFITCMYRSMSERGYAALVAAFSSPILLFGAVKFVDDKESLKLEQFIIARLECSAIGVLIYLCVEVLLWPIQPHGIVHDGSLKWFTHLDTYFQHVTSMISQVSKVSQTDAGSISSISQTDPGSINSISNDHLLLIKQAKQVCQGNSAISRKYLMSAVNSPYLRFCNNTKKNRGHRRFGLKDEEQTDTELIASQHELTENKKKILRSLQEEEQSFVEMLVSQSDRLKFPHFEYMKLFKHQERICDVLTQMEIVLQKVQPAVNQEQLQVIDGLFKCVTEQISKCADVTSHTEHNELNDGAQFRHFRQIQKRIISVWSNHLRTVVQKYGHLEGQKSKEDPAGQEGQEDLVQSRSDSGENVVGEELEMNDSEKKEIKGASDGARFQFNDTKVGMLNQEQVMVMSALLSQLLDVCQTMEMLGQVLENMPVH